MLAFLPKALAERQQRMITKLSVSGHPTTILPTTEHQTAAALQSGRKRSATADDFASDSKHAYVTTIVLRLTHPV
ncbi:hypothetical protein ABZX30_37720 [Streptomyces sp. NPDC004542]|uniref:hypothetical protein n=1 Tax=Streptomyces sp. NPDC004542 TaxID=3154281 RepID=UPI0033A90C66